MAPILKVSSLLSKGQSMKNINLQFNFAPSEL